MKRVNAEKQFGVPQSLLMAGMVLASVSAQADGLISFGSGNAVSNGAIYILNPNPVVVFNPSPITLPSVNTLNAASASSSVSGSLSYNLGSSYGSFSENDSTADGSQVGLELNRKGYGYLAEASAENGQAKTRAETQSVTTGNGYGNSSASATSSWNDWFVISGGTGLGTASFVSELNGTLASGKNGSAGYSLNIGYSTGSYCYYYYNTCSEADQSQTLFSQSSSLYGKGKSTLSQDIEGEFTFEYDKAFQLTATLGSNASNGGQANFTLASLGSSLVLPEGSSLMGSSGLYVQAVPEADTYAMMLAGLGLVGFAVARRRAIAK